MAALEESKQKISSGDIDEARKEATNMIPLLPQYAKDAAQTQKKILTENLEFVKSTLAEQARRPIELTVYALSEPDVPGPEPKKAAANPGRPTTGAASKKMKPTRREAAA